MMKLRINPIVAEDLKNIREYIAEDNEEMAVKTIQEIYARIEKKFLSSSIICGTNVLCPAANEETPTT